MGIQSKQSREPTLKLKVLSAGLAGCIGDVVTFPLDVAKVRLQTYTVLDSLHKCTPSHVGVT